jgi:hypothetical protein
MSRKDDLALTGQGIGETTRTDALREKLYSKPWSDSFMDMMLHARQLERELNQANAIIKKCLCLMPVGYIPYHTPESLPSRISFIFAEREDYRKERNQAINERDRAQASLRTLIALHEREIETGQPISGEDWEIAGYALTDK